MASSEHWTFDMGAFLRQYTPEDTDLIADMFETPSIRVMDYLRPLIVDGPQVNAVDWTDRYGWVVLSAKELLQIKGDFYATIERWLAESKEG